MPGVANALLEGTQAFSRYGSEGSSGGAMHIYPNNVRPFRPHSFGSSDKTYSTDVDGRLPRSPTSGQSTMSVQDKQHEAYVGMHEEIIITGRTTITELLAQQT